MEISPISDRLVKVTLTGRLDAPTVDRIETRLTAALVPGANNAIIDLSGVDFVASLGIRMLISAAKSLKMRQAKLAVYGTQDQVRQVFELVSLQQMLNICATEEEARAAVAPAR